MCRAADPLAFQAPELAAVALQADADLVAGRQRLKSKPDQARLMRCSRTLMTSVRDPKRQSEPAPLPCSCESGLLNPSLPGRSRGCVWLRMAAAVRLHYCLFPLILLSNTLSPSLGRESQHDAHFCVNFILRERSSKHRRGLGDSLASGKQRAAQ